MYAFNHKLAYRILKINNDENVIYTSFNVEVFHISNVVQPAFLKCLVSPYFTQYRCRAISWLQNVKYVA